MPEPPEPVVCPEEDVDVPVDPLPPPPQDVARTATATHAPRRMMRKSGSQSASVNKARDIG
jgi:hypothetical protein